MLGYRREELLARSWREMTVPEDLPASTAQLARIAGGEIDSYSLEKRWIRRDGQTLHSIVSVRCARRPDGAVDHFVALVQDITERKLGEEVLRRAKEAAEEVGRLKDQFLATLSHELRTPLAAILLWGRLLAKGAVRERDRASALRSIVAAAEAQNQLIEDLLDVSRMASGKVRLALRETELGQVARAAAEAVRPLADARGVRLEIAGGDDGGALTVNGDPDRLRQVVWNLLTNAVKFTRRDGRVELRLQRAGSAARVVVSDNGQGIPAVKLPHLFDRFGKADGGTTRVGDGLGLGLTIVRDLTELHGGVVRGESPGEGQGATFTLELPLLAVSDRALASRGGAPSVEPLAAPRILKGKRVLLVEDDADTRTALAWLLEECRAHVTPVDSAARALESFRRAVRRRPFDLLLSDIGMPGQDGYALLKQVRAVEQEVGGRLRAIPAIALTAYAREEDRQKALSSGFQLHLAKPIRPPALIRAISEVMGRAKVIPRARAAGARAGRSPKKAQPQV